MFQYIIISGTGFGKYYKQVGTKEQVVKLGIVNKTRLLILTWCIMHCVV